MEELVSVIIPAYNCEKTIMRCVNSISQQTYKKIEIIVIDDGSTDNTPNILLDLSKNIPNLKIYIQCNLGVSATRNKGINLCLGNWIAFCDSDDYVEKEYISSLVENQINYQSDWCISGFNKIINNKKYIFDKPFSKNCINKDEIEDFTGKWYKSPYIAGPCGKLYKREIILFNNIFFPVDMTHGEDTVFNILYVEKCSKISFVNRSTYNYIDTYGSLTKSFQADIWDNQIKIFNAFKDMCNKKSFNSKIIYQFYTRCLTITFNSLASGKADLFKWKKNINRIIKDDTIKKINLKNLSLDKLSEITVFLLKSKQIYGLIYFYRVKLFIYNYFNRFYYLFRR